MSAALTIQLKLDAGQVERGLRSLRQEVQQAESHIRRGLGGALHGLVQQVQRIGSAFKGIPGGRELKELSASATEAGKSLGALSGILHKTSLASLAVGGAIGTAVAGAISTLVSWARQGTEALATQESLENRIAAALRRRGEASAELTKALSEQAENLKRLNAVDDDAIRSAQLIFLSYQNIATDALPRVSQAAIDLALSLRSVTGENVDLVQVSRMLGRALNDPQQGMEALARLGIQLDEQTKQYIKTLQEQGRLQEAQAALLGEIEKRVGGAGRAYAESAQGIQQAFQLALADLGKALAPVILEVQRSILPILTDMLQAIGPAVAEIAKLIGSTLGPILGQVFSAFVPVVEAVVRGLRPLGELLSKIAGIVGQAIQPVLEAVASVLTEIAGIFEELLGSLLKELEPILNELGQILGEMGREFGRNILELFNEAKPLIREIIALMAQGLVGALRGVVSIVRAMMPVMTLMARITTTVLAYALKVAVWLFQKLAEAAKWVWQQIVKVVEAIAGFIRWVGKLLGLVKDSSQQTAEAVAKTGQELKETRQEAEGLGIAISEVPQDVGPSSEELEKKKKEMEQLRQKVADLRRELAEMALRAEFESGLLQLDLLRIGVEGNIRSLERALRDGEEVLRKSAEEFARGAIDVDTLRQRADEALQVVQQLAEKRRQVIELESQRELRQLEQRQQEELQQFDSKASELLQKLRDLGSKELQIRERQRELEEERAKIVEKYRLEREIAEQKRLQDLLRVEEETADQVNRIHQNVTEAIQRREEKLTEEREQQLNRFRESVERWSDVVSESLQGFWQGQTEGVKQFVRVWLQQLLALAENELSIAIFRVLAQELGSKGIVGLATAAAAVGILKAAFAAMRSAVKGFREGGWTGEGAVGEIAGIVHKREYVIPYPYSERYRALLDEIRRGRLPMVPPSVESHIRGRIDIRLDDMLIAERISLSNIRVRVLN